MTRALALDLTRLALGPVRWAPRGIDRIELAYANYFLKNWPGECYPVLPTVWGVRLFDRQRGLAGIQALEALWRETLDPLHDPQYLRTKNFIKGIGRGGLRPVEATRPNTWTLVGGYKRLLSATGFEFGKPIAQDLPKKAIYLNVGQLEVYRPLLTWLKHRRDVQSVFMIHDLIPLQYPEHHLMVGVKLHMSIMRNTAEFARSVIVPSAAVREVVRAEMAQYGRHDLRVHVEHLPVPREFAVRTEIDPDLPHECYFIVCGAIDSYKNHLFLLEVWQRLAARLGQQTPKLVIAGSPGVSGERVIAYLKEHVALHEHVILASGLATKALRQLMIGAHALLMPSLAEGFGLPIIEALAQGTPVIASDIPAHREAGRRGDVTYLTPTDVESWLGCIEAMAGQPKRSGLPGQPYKPKSWKSYFMGIEAYLSKIQRLSAIQR